MPAIKAASEIVEGAAKESGPISTLARQAVDLLLSREAAPIQTVRDMKASAPYAEAFNVIPSKFDVSQTFLTGNRLETPPGNGDQLKWWMDNVGLGPGKRTLEYPMAVWEQGIHGLTNRLSVFRRNDGINILHASDQLPSSWRVSVSGIGPEADKMTDVTSFLNSGTTRRGYVHSLVSPDTRELAVYPGMKIRLSVGDSEGNVGLIREMATSPKFDTASAKLFNHQLNQDVQNGLVQMTASDGKATFSPTRAGMPFKGIAPPRLEFTANEDFVAQVNKQSSN